MCMELLVCMVIGDSWFNKLFLDCDYEMDRAYFQCPIRRINCMS